MDSTGNTLEGTVEEVIFRNAANGYTVISLANESELITAVGIMPDVNAGDMLTLTGVRETHRSYGEQFKVESYSTAVPKSVEQILKYLSSGMIKGVGPKTAATLVERFGEETLAVIEHSPERVAAIKGITLEKAQNISKQFKEQTSLRASIMQLGQFGLTPLESVRIFKKLGESSADAVKHNPYVLCTLGVGVSFEKAEEIESKLDARPDASFRTDAAVLHILRHNRSSVGHTCVPRNKLIALICEYIGISNDEADIAIDRLTGALMTRVEVIDGEEFVFLASVYLCEKNIARSITNMATRCPPTPIFVPKTELERNEDGIEYAQRQREAIMMAVKKGLLILTGGPGTGKTTTIRGILSLFDRQGINVELAAPTGRAAQRMAEVTGREAKTIHRLLEVQWDEDDEPVFTRNAQNTLDCEAVVLDELSMVDIALFESFLSALPVGCRLIMVGDADQLPPVGAGNVLRDLIKSGVLPVIELDTVFRQALESAIIRNAHHIVKGEAPELDNAEGTDFFHMERPAPYSTAVTVADLCETRLPKAYGYSFLTDIQVICPSRKGEAGTRSLNALLQSRLNPPSKDKKELPANGSMFRVGDKVMQIRNDYSLTWERDGRSGEGVFNGDIGILKEIIMSSGEMKIDFDGKLTTYPFENLDELELSYAVTVHKSQGSEFKAVILACSGVPSALSYRNLLYTAVTRAKERIITVGSAEQICKMAYNDRKAKRYSAMWYFLREYIGTDGGSGVE